MNKTQLLANSTQLMGEAFAVLKAKATYSTEEDALCAFKKEAAVAQLLGLEATNPRHRCYIEVVKKISRLVRMENERWPKGIDSVLDSHIDIINYILLSYGLTKEATDDAT